MSYIFRFTKSDKITNLVKTYPQVSFAFYSGSSYYNNNKTLSGLFTGSILGMPSGFISLYELNIDRSGTLNFAAASSSAAGAEFRDPFKYAVQQGIDPTLYYLGDNPRIASFVVKNGTRLNYKTVSAAEFNNTDIGDPLVKNYPLSCSVEKYYYAATDARYVASTEPATGAPQTGSITYLYALKNTLNSYRILNPLYAVSSSVRNLTASVVAEGAVEVGLVTIPSLFYGDNIKKGTVDLKFYITGTLVGQLKDTNRDGVLYQVGPVNSNGSGSTAGLVLYNEGFIVLTGSWDLTSADGAFSPSHTEVYGTTNDYPTWTAFAQTISGSATDLTATSSSCFLDFSGSHVIPTMMLFATAPQNQLNHSNNPTYRDFTSPQLMASASTGYEQYKDAAIKNTVSSSYNSPTGSFQKITYISKVGIYDRDKNLIGIAKLAKPVKKLEEREITFKLKLDI